MSWFRKCRSLRSASCRVAVAWLGWALSLLSAVSLLYVIRHTVILLSHIKALNQQTLIEFAQLTHESSCPDSPTAAAALSWITDCNSLNFSFRLQELSDTLDQRSLTEAVERAGDLLDLGWGDSVIEMLLSHPMETLLSALSVSVLVVWSVAFVLWPWRELQKFSAVWEKRQEAAMTPASSLLVFDGGGDGGSGGRSPGSGGGGRSGPPGGAVAAAVEPTPARQTAGAGATTPSATPLSVIRPWVAHPLQTHATLTRRHPPTHTPDADY